MKNIESIAVKSEEFRRVLYTAKNCQLVVMALKPKEEIGTEVHKLDQFFRVEEGMGEAVLDGVSTAISAGFAVLVPAGTNHNIVNTGNVPLKLYTLYAPPNHRDGVVHHTRADAEADSDTSTEERVNSEPAGTWLERRGGANSSDHDHQVALQIDVRYPTLRKRTSRSEEGHR